MHVSTGPSHSVPEYACPFTKQTEHIQKRARPQSIRLRLHANTRLVGVCAFSSSLRGLKWIPSKWRYLVPPTSGYANRWVLKVNSEVSKLAIIMCENNPALEKFLNTCRTEFRFLITDFGFQEFKGPKNEFANPFKLCFVRDDLEVSIEGIHYGSTAMVLLTDKRNRVLGPRNLDPAFNPFDKKAVKALPKANGQTEEIVQEAQLLLEHGRDLLNGDFSVFEEAFARKTQVWAEYGKRSTFGIAVQEAVAAYDEERWQDVIRLLEPHEQKLSKKMAKKLAFARSQL